MRFFGWIKSLYSKDLDEEVIEEVAREYRISPNELKKEIRGVNILPLPFISYAKKIGNKVYKKIGKVLGAYNPLRKEIYIDLWVYLQKVFGNLKPYVKTFAEEVCHAAQKYLGRLKPRSFSDYLENYENDENEREAKEKAEKVTRRMLSKYGRYNFYSLLSLF